MTTIGPTVISEGTAAPGFELPALVDGERRRVALEEYLGDDVVILAFYPADFNPACDETSCDLDELDLFTMQKDVSILGISPDSVYSHQAFADTYDLNVPLLSDTDHEVAREYGIDFVDDIGQQLIERSVVVVDHDGVVQYAWSTADLAQLPIVEEIKDAIADTGGDDTAFARYRVGHAHYTEARRSFTSAMKKFENSEWMMAQNDFQQARAEFEEAEDHFDTAVRFVDHPALGPIYDDSKTKANSLWQAADWLAQSASAYSSGSGAEGQQLREDAERPIETARGYMDPPDPDEWPPEADDLEKAEERSSILPQEGDGEAASLGVDIDDEVESGADQDYADGSAETDTDPEPSVEHSTQQTSGATGQSAAKAMDEPQTAPQDSAEAPATEKTVDDAELEEIQAELEATSPAEEPSTEEVMEESTSMVDAPPEAAGEADDSGETTQPAARQSDSSNESEPSESVDTATEMPAETVDDAELEEIQAEVEANNPAEEPSTDDVIEEPTSMVDSPPETAPEDSARSDDETTIERDEPADTAEDEPRQDEP